MQKILIAVCLITFSGAIEATAQSNIRDDANVRTERARCDEIVAQNETDPAELQRRFGDRTAALVTMCASQQRNLEANRRTIKS